MNNLIIRTALLKTGLRIWELADILNISEPTIYRKLRKELPVDEQLNIAAMISDHAAKGGQDHE